MNRSLLLTIPLFLVALVIVAQERIEPIDGHSDSNAPPSHQIPAPPAAPAVAGADYVLGPGDQISVLVPDLDDQFTTDKNFRIDMSGDLSLPLAGRIHAAGLTIPVLEKEIDDALVGHYLKRPQAVVNVTEFHSQPVSVFGEVNAPGLHQLVGTKNLFNALSLAGGFTDNLGNTIQITRRLQWGRIPLPNAHDDPTGQFSIASLNMRNVLKPSDPSENIPLMPDDVISVSRSEVVYAVGSFNKPGGFELGQNESLTSLQVVSLAQGLQRTAAADRAMILRVVPGAKTRTQIPVNVKQLLAGNGTDVTLQADDILFVPNSKAKSASYGTLDAILRATTGVATYGRY